MWWTSSELVLPTEREGGALAHRLLHVPLDEAPLRVFGSVGWGREETFPMNRPLTPVDLMIDNAMTMAIVWLGFWIAVLEPQESEDDRR